MPIPAFTTSGVLPPFVGDTPTDPAQMAPFVVSYSELANRFGATPARWNLLQGLADYRATLRATGIAFGFQWIDGSYLEDSEALRSRPPADIDLVTFALLPPGLTPREFRDRHSHLIETRMTRPQFGCDAYFVDLGLGVRRPDLLVMQTRYWYGLFSHQRCLEPLERYASNRFVLRRRRSDESGSCTRGPKCCASLNVPDCRQT